MTEPVALKYRALISYSHADTAQAKWLHRGLESFRIDGDLAGRETRHGPIPKTLKPIFRDRDDFTAGHTLTEQTLAALDASSALIVICSPAAAKSHYVNEEIRLFKQRHPKRPVIPLIIGGKPGDPTGECFPPALKFKLDAKGRIGKKPLELLAADAREEGDGKSLALAKVIAGILDVTSDEVFRRAERERRRKARLRNGVIGVLAFLSVAAVGSAAYAWQQLKTNEAFLKATLKTATEIVDDAVNQAEKYGVPRTATLALLTRAEGLFDNMAMLGKPTPELRYQKAWMLVQFAHNYEALGDTTKWRERALAAQQLLQTLSDEDPANTAYIRDLAIAESTLGDALAARGDLDGALQSYGTALSRALRLANADPDNGGLLRDVAVEVERIGAIQLQQGKLADALKSFQQSEGLAEILARADPSDPTLQRDLAVSHNKIGDVLQAQGDLAGALDEYHKALAITERIANQDPHNALWQRDLSYSYNEVGVVLSAQGKPDEALKSFRDGLEIRRRLANTDPSNAGWQHDVAVAYDRVGDALVSQGGLEDGLQSYRDERTILERLIRSDPNNALWQRDLSVALGKIGDVQLAQGDAGAALASYGDDLAIAKRLAEAAPDNAGWQRDLAVSYNKLGGAEKAGGKLDEALKSYEQGREIMERLAKNDPSNAGWQRDVSVSDIEIGNVALARGDAEEALKFYQDSLAIRGRLTRSDPNNTDWQRDLAIAHGRVGLALAQQGKMDAAFAELREGRELVAKLKEKSSASAALTQDLVWFDKTLAGLEEAVAPVPQELEAKPELP
jgi:tetratricopeptide (TPR) repeat protein